MVDFSDTILVDHTVMQKLSEMQSDFKEAGSSLVIEGLEQHRSLSEYPTAGRQKRRKPIVQQV